MIILVCLLLLIPQLGYGFHMSSLRKWSDSSLRHSEITERRQSHALTSSTRHYVETPYRNSASSKYKRSIDKNRNYLDNEILIDIIPEEIERKQLDVSVHNVNVMKSKPYVILHGNDINIVDGPNIYPLLSGVQSISKSDQADDGSGVFLSFQLPESLSQHDVSLGHASKSKLMSLSRIKRWWQAPSFLESIDEIPVETQLLLMQISKENIAPISDSNHLLSDGKDKDLHRHYNNIIDTSDYTYAVIIPLIDPNSNFRCTLYGHDGDNLTPRGQLAMRMESGDSTIQTSFVETGLYVAVGNNPYQMIQHAYESIAQRLGTFRTREEKFKPKGLDSFGFCTWDAFYSKVDDVKVKNAVESLRNIGVPPKFVIIDDGWQSTGLQEDAQGSTDISKPSDSKNTVLADDGDLSGAQIDGSVAAQTLASSNDNPFISFATKLASEYYVNHVESASPDSFTMKIWQSLSQTVFKDTLIQFFNSQTDFSKRLLSWKANKKFEDESKGKTLKSFVKSLKSDLGVDFVYFWHALSGYWGGVSENSADDLNAALLQARSELLSIDNVGSMQTFRRKIQRAFRSAFTWMFSFVKKISKASDSSPVSSEKTPQQDSTLKPMNIVSKANAIEEKDIQPVKKQFPNPTPHLLNIEPSMKWDPASLAGVGSVAVEKLDEMYRKMHEYLADSGADGVKVDAQAGIATFGSAVARAAVQAMEKSVKNTFKDIQNPTPYNRMMRRLRSLFVRNFPSLVEKDRYLEGCMSHCTDNLYNYYETSLIRASDDFYPKDMASQTVHIVSCAFNSIMLGEIGTPDWDMFHSKHAFAQMHANARAISGGPVYVSDYPGNHDASLLKSMVLPDGHILRTQTPLRPTVDCLFASPMTDRITALKTWSCNKVNAVIGAFNVQGYTWDRKLRKYTQIPHRLQSFLTDGSVIAHIRADDIANEEFHQVNENIPSNEISPSFIAFSAKEKSLKLLKSRQTIMDVALDSQESDIISLSHVYRINRSEKDQKKSWFTRTLKNMVQYPNSNRKDSSIINHDDPMIYFSPIGLTDMINCGGAVESVEIEDRSCVAHITAKGVGIFTIFLSTLPRNIYINGILHPDYNYERIEKGNTINRYYGDHIEVADTPEGFIVKIPLRSKLSTSKSLEEKEITIEW